MTMQPIHAPLAFHPVPAQRHYDAHQAAAAVGLSRDRFRKVRTAWTRDRDFPAEINEPGEPIRYLADAVDRWVQRRTQRVHQLAEAKTPPPAPPQSGQKGRAALRSIKGRG